MSEQTLESILSGEQPQEAVTEPVEQPEVEQEAPPEEPTTGEQEEASPPDAEEPDDSTALIPKKAVIDERRKRQELEARLEAMEKELQRTKNPQPQPEPVKEPDMFEDPEGYRQYQRMVAKQENAAAMAAMARTLIPDYAEMEAIFVEAAQMDRSGHLIAQLRQSENPAIFALEMGRQIKAQREIQQVGSVDALREQIRQEERQKLLAEQQGKQQARDDKGKFIKPSLATARAAAPNSDEGDDSLASLTRLG